jgi:hypothetical protein
VVVENALLFSLRERLHVHDYSTIGQWRESGGFEVGAGLAPNVASRRQDETVFAFHSRLHCLEDLVPALGQFRRILN